MTRRVSRNVGVNPIARAVARQQMNKSITDMRIMLHMLDSGDDFAPHLEAVWVPVFALFTAMDVLGEANSVDARKLKGAVSVLNTLRKDTTWSKAHVPTINGALQIVTERWHKLPADLANQATQLAMQSYQQRREEIYGAN
jgi:hypothetical protein